MKDQEGFLPRPKNFSTNAIHHGQDPEQWDCMEVVTPIVTSVTFKREDPATPKKFNYARFGNPTRRVLEEVFAKLDNGKRALVFSSGSSAIMTVFCLLSSGDNLVISDDIYGGTTTTIKQMAESFKIDVTFVDCSDMKNVEKAIKSNTKMLYVETPTNPTCKVVDLRAASILAKEKKILLAVDNTFLTPYFQRPLDLGVDLAIYSVTKYIGGHSDLIMGAITMNDEKLYEYLYMKQKSFGAIPSPIDCYQVIRSLKTLAIRMEQHNENALLIVEYLLTHPLVEKVLYPGHPSHPQYDLYRKQTSGCSGMVSLYIKGGLKEAYTFMNNLKVFLNAGSLGSTESLVSSPAASSHVDLTPEKRLEIGVTDNLVRLSVGLEDSKDLIEDLKQAFDSIAK